MATRLYLSGVAPSFSPAYDAAWEQTADAERRTLVRKNLFTVVTGLFNNPALTVPITTTQQILSRQYISPPLPGNMTVGGTFSMVIRVLESAATANAFLAFVLNVISNDGSILRGTLASSMTNAGTEFATSAATRIFSAVALSNLDVLAGDRVVVEMGVHAQGPTAGTTATFRYGYAGGTADFALTSALTTDLNPWVEFSQDLWPAMPSNYQSVSVGDGMSTNERLR